MRRFIHFLFILGNPTPSERAKFLFKMLPKDTESEINTLECLKALVDADLVAKEKRNNYENKVISQYLPKEMKVIHQLHTDLPLSEVETEYN